MRLCLNSHSLIPFSSDDNQMTLQLIIDHKSVMGMMTSPFVGFLDDAIAYYSSWMSTGATENKWLKETTCMSYHFSLVSIPFCLMVSEITVVVLTSMGRMAMVHPRIQHYAAPVEGAEENAWQLLSFEAVLDLWRPSENATINRIKWWLSHLDV